MALTIGIRFLTGTCVAARSKTDPLPEWPPHPARVFAALAAAYFECGLGEGERGALCWLESLPPPEVSFSALAIPSEAIPTFVPMNDANAVGKGGSIQSLPMLKRHRAERMFPRTHVPAGEDCIYLNWQDAPDGEVAAHRDALTNLCNLTGRLGHSSSLVHVWVSTDVPGGLKTVMPQEIGGTQMRVASQGTLDKMIVAYMTPPNFRFASYRSVGYGPREEKKPEAAGTVFNHRVEVLRLLPDKGNSLRWMQLETTLALMTTLREAILSQCSAKIPETISGHAAHGKPSFNPHIALLPLAFTDAPYADGHLMGAAIALPRGMDRDDVRVLQKALSTIVDEGDEKGNGLGFDSRRFPGLGQWRLVRDMGVDTPAETMKLSTWTGAPGGFQHWASVTPVVYDQHAKAKEKAAYLKQCAEDVKVAVRRVLMEDVGVDVRVCSISPHSGVPPAWDFPRLKRKDGSERRHAHVELWFDRPVVGPLLVGAGRYKGYGLFRPIRPIMKEAP